MKEYMDFDTACTDINRGLCTVEKIDWEFMLVQLSLMSNYMGNTEPLMIVNNTLSKIYQYDTRIDVLKHLLDSIEDDENSDQWKANYECLIPFYRKIHEVKQSSGKFKKKWGDGFIVCNECAIFMQGVSPEEMVAYSQSILESSKNPTSSNPIWYQISRLYQFIDKLLTDNITEFITYMYCAEKYHQYLTGDYEEMSDMPTSISIPVSLRNACFDIYIRMRAQDIESAKSKDDTILKMPSATELLSILCEKETYNIQLFNDTHKEANIECNFELIPTNEILKLSNLFLEYLQDMIVNHMPIPSKQEPKKSLPRMPYCTYIVPNAPKTRDEIEADIVRASRKSAQVFANLLTKYKEHGYLDFRGEGPSEVYEYMKERYSFDYSEGNFTRYFKG